MTEPYDKIYQKVLALSDAERSRVLLAIVGRMDAATHSHILGLSQFQKGYLVSLMERAINSDTP